MSDGLNSSVGQNSRYVVVSNVFVQEYDRDTTVCVYAPFPISETSAAIIQVQLYSIYVYLFKLQLFYFEVN